MKIKATGPFVPERQREGDAGYDIKAHMSGMIYGKQSMLVQTGLRVEIPPGYVGILKSRSGLAVKEDIHVRAGVIDSNYRGDVGVLLHNSGELPYIFEEGDRIAQLLIVPCMDVEWDMSGELTDSTRGEEGYGSSGK